jgi:hypothetical protein
LLVGVGDGAGEGFGASKITDAGRGTSDNANTHARSSRSPMERIMASARSKSPLLVEASATSASAHL